MDLDLDIGRPRTTVMEVARELEAGDLPRLAGAREGGTFRIKKLRDRHHSLARCIADGMTEGEAALVTGYTLATVRMIAQDHSFVDLVSMYQGRKAEKYDEMHELLGALGKDSVRELLDRLEEEGEKFTIKELRELAAFAADRSGHGPTNKQEVSHTINFGDRLEAARRRMLPAEGGSGTVREAVIDPDAIDVTSEDD